MKVGISIGNLTQEIGGGYTFESEIFQSLVNFGSQGGHNFVIYSWDKEAPTEVLSSPHLEFVSLQRDIKQRLIDQLSRRAIAIQEKIKNSHAEFTIKQWQEQLLLDYLRKNGVDITWSFVHGCMSMEMPYITTVWDLQHRLQPYFPEVSVEGEWDRREHIECSTRLRRAAFVITGTKVGKSEIEYFYQVPRERIKVLPFPTPQFALNHRIDDEINIFQKYQIPQQYLFYPAQFWANKNHINLLLAIKYLLDKYGLEFPVVFVGSDHGNQTYVQEIVTELNLNKQVYFLGFVPQKDVISLYKNAFALTYMTFFGPDNLPPLEAFALGCPVIASKVSGAEEQLEDAALLVDPKDPEHIASAIKSLWDHKELRQTLIQRGAKRAAKWTGKDYIQGVFSILDEFQAIRRCWSNTKPYYRNSI
ncbi:glycosyltransferase family 1 protein [Calothrix sp. PCC 7507]|uniref:glycosyltransferase family 4 protein n=1 Tax=Calothrix sp. PCC 7507 TaxID=99598 RepID=UPI00029F3C9A|nr:glycosyltransferase family 1 protein [Calothrix sp. PCC 7507]AFY34231.1 glycosyl transferase group 1 [Calothrix sp. PCC 7507]